jgi:hypothetical protein
MNKLQLIYYYFVQKMGFDIPTLAKLILKKRIF